MSEKLSLIPATAASLNRTDLLYLAADQGAGAFLENKMPISLIGESAFNLNGIDNMPVATVLLQNATAATSLVRQISPAIQFTGQGFATTPATSQAVDWMIYNQTVTSAANPVGNLLFDYSVDGGAFVNKVSFDSLGTINATRNLIAANSVITGAAGVVAFSGRTALSSSANGILTLTNAESTNFTRLTLGGVSSAFPAISRNGAGIDFRLANDSAYTKITTGDIQMAVASLFSVTSGTNTRAGNAVLVAGTVTVANTTVTADTLVVLTRKTSGGTIGTSITYTVSAGASFTITSDNILDTSTFTYFLIERP